MVRGTGAILGDSFESCAMQQCRPKSGQRRPVRIIETGEKFPSLSEAGRQKYLTPAAIHQAIANGWCSGGGHWEYVD